MNRALSALAAAFVCAAVTLTASPAQAFGGGFVRVSTFCPSGKVVLGGGAQVVGEGSGDFITVMQETGPTTSGGLPVWATAMKNNDLFSSHTVGFFAVCANTGLPGHQIVQRNVSMDAHSFVRTTVTCPAGTVSLSGGAFVVGEGASNFETTIRESSPGNSPSSSLWMVAMANNDSSAHTVALLAVCANAPSGYEIVRVDHTILAGALVRSTTRCPSGKVSLGGGAQVVGAGSADFGTRLQESSPGDSPTSDGWTNAFHNGGDSHTIGTYVVCANAPAGYQIVRRTVTV